MSAASSALTGFTAAALLAYLSKEFNQASTDLEDLAKLFEGTCTE